MRKQFQQGFTLVELMAVMAVIGIVSALAMPSFSSLLEKQRISSRSHELHVFLQAARIEAVTRNRTVSICASENGNGCSGSRNWSGKSLLAFVDDNRNGKIDQKEAILQVQESSRSNETVTWRSFRNKSYLQWQPTGSTFYQNGNITLCPKSGDPRHAGILILNAAGRIYPGSDRNHDGIPEGSDGKNVRC